MKLLCPPSFASSLSSNAKLRANASVGLNNLTLKQGIGTLRSSKGSAMRVREEMKLY